MTIATGEQAKASDINELVTLVEKTADQTVNNSDVLVNDTVLLFPIKIDERWAFDITLFCSGNQAADIKFAITLPANAEMKWSIPGSPLTDGTYSFPIVKTVSGESIAVGLHASGLGCRIIGFVDGDDTAGNVRLQWAQAAAHGSDTKVLLGSYIRAHRLA